MITHDVDEAMLLADKIMLMSNGPRARIAEIVQTRCAQTAAATPSTRTRSITRSATTSSISSEPFEGFHRTAARGLRSQASAAGHAGTRHRIRITGNADFTPRATRASWSACALALNLKGGMHETLEQDRSRISGCRELRENRCRAPTSPKWW